MSLAEAMDTDSLVCFAGGTAYDTVVALNGPLEHGSDTVCDLLHRGPAGKTTNSATRCALLGAKTVLVTAVGPDAEGHAIKDACLATPNLMSTFQPLEQTLHCTVMLTPDGERTIVAPLAATHRDPVAADIDLAGFGWLWTFIADDDIRGGFHAAGEGLPVRRGLAAEKLEAEAKAGRRWEYAVGSLSDRDLPSERLLGKTGLQFCVMTDGADGGYHWSRESDYTWDRFDAAPLRGPVVDSCGAGDAFLGGLMAGLARGLDLKSACEAGSFCGARACETLGGWPPNPHPLPDSFTDPAVPA